MHHITAPWVAWLVDRELLGLGEAQECKDIPAPTFSDSIGDFGDMGLTAHAGHTGGLWANDMGVRWVGGDICAV